jgi:hypothetical protein
MVKGCKTTDARVFYTLAIGVVRQECRTYTGYFIIISFFTDVKVLPVPDAGVAFMRMK